MEEGKLAEENNFAKKGDLATRVTLPRMMFSLKRAILLATKGNFPGDGDLPWRATIPTFTKEGNLAKDDNCATKGGLAKDGIFAKEGNVYKVVIVVILFGVVVIVVIVVVVVAIVWHHVQISQPGTTGLPLK